MASGKPVVTAEDSGGVLEFIKAAENGLVVNPDIDSIGHAVNELVENREKAAALGEAGRNYIQQSGLLESGWDKVTSALLSPLEERQEANAAKA